MNEAHAGQMLGQWLRHSQDLLDFTVHLAGCDISAPDTPHDKQVAKVVAFKFAQGVRTFRSVLLLADAGDATNSFILMRSLFESLVDVAYLIENPKDVWRYLEESAELEAKIRAAASRYGPPAQNDFSKKRPSPEQLREEFSQLGAAHSSCKSWRRLSLKARAEKTGYPEIVALYEIIYPTASAYVHGGSGIILDYLRNVRGSESEFRVDYERVDSEIEPSIGLSATVFLHLLAFLDALFGLGLRPRIERMHQEQLALHQNSFAGLAARFQ